jgi:alkylhydroperoxidase domain protein
MTVPTVQDDAISDLAGVQPGSALAELRAQRPEATRHAQGSYNALFANPSGSLTLIERLSAAQHVATLHSATGAAEHYRKLRQDAGAGSSRLPAILRHADLLATRPRQARPEDLQALADAGLSTAEIVTLSQVIAFVSFQVRVIAGLQLLADRPPASPPANGAQATRQSELKPAAGDAHHPPAARIIRPDKTITRPGALTVDQLAWTPWLEPLDLADATPQQAAALEGSRGNSPYFRLLALDADVLTERTATDRGIFYTPGGAPRAERELAAAATSRLNGCIYCASVHARLAAQLSKRHEDVDRLLRQGVAPGTDLGLDPRWRAEVDLAVALAATPPTAAAQHVTALRDLGLSDLEILDVMQAGAFFAWANRLMLTLGEPYYADD